MARRLAALIIVALLTACGGARRASTENDRLRARVMELEDEVTALAARAAELEAELAAPPPTAPPSAASEEVRRNTPHVTNLQIGRLSHLADADGDGRPEAAVLYVHPRDGRGRFVQIVGAVDVHVAVLPSDADAVTLGRVRLTPDEVRDAYRSAFTGTHYTIEVPLRAVEAEVIECAVQLEFEDGLTGRTLTASRTVTPRVLAAGEEAP